MSSLTPDALARDLGIRPDEKLPKVSDMNARALATLTRNATPPGSFVDLCPVHLITETSLSTIATAMGVDHLEARRFRPNVVLAGGPPADVLPESAWPDTALDVGGARLRVVMRTVRCVVPSRAHEDLPVEAALTRAVAGTADRYLGVYADVTTAGRIRVGDTLTITPPTPPSPTRRLARRGRVLALDSANRLIEMFRRD
ncbi:MOSC domain-containing protein [Gordonia sp. HNM0687]|uniref:MOSC domain-containing protein n=1 Tax=Gordonia mangrovi TaxID=2665643 RepID=A0A6L7GM41_9ACTN|nr:MOSC domain-containing protein [Gordonia mangrovi]MXP19835.1 MOSC domain-containing protein [Gordonia mangrovi]UVF79539.1 MOSC domain-containing protein [Gordonia mangrovi]